MDVTGRPAEGESDAPAATPSSGRDTKVREVPAERPARQNGRILVSVRFGDGTEDHLLVGQEPLSDKENKIRAITSWTSRARSCRIAGADMIEDEDVRVRWPGLRTIVEITSTVTAGDESVMSVRHYISDEDYPKAAYCAMLAHGHWGIEN